MMTTGPDNNVSERIRRRPLGRFSDATDPGIADSFSTGQLVEEEGRGLVADSMASTGRS